MWQTTTKFSDLKQPLLYYRSWSNELTGLSWLVLAWGAARLKQNPGTPGLPSLSIQSCGISTQPLCVFFPQSRLDFLWGYSRLPRSGQGDLLTAWLRTLKNITIPTCWRLKRVTGPVRIPWGGVTCGWDYRKHSSLGTLWEIPPADSK